MIKKIFYLLTLLLVMSCWSQVDEKSIYDDKQENIDTFLTLSPETNTEEISTQKQIIETQDIITHKNENIDIYDDITIDFSEIQEETSQEDEILNDVTSQDIEELIDILLDTNY